MRRTFGRLMASVCVASTSATWLVPMPKAIAAERAVRAGVAVAAGDRHAGLRQALFRADDVHDPLPVVVRLNSVTPNSRQFFSMADIISSASTSTNGRTWLSVGTMWSTVASVRSGYSTFSSRSRSISNACGLVTS